MPDLFKPDLAKLTQLLKIAELKEYIVDTLKAIFRRAVQELIVYKKQMARKAVMEIILLSG